MSHLDRFYATIERKPVDRPCIWLGMPVPEARQALYSHFKVGSYRALVERLNDDIVPVELPYHSTTSNAIYAAFDFAQKGRIEHERRNQTAHSSPDCRRSRT